MLVLSRKSGERIQIGDGITVAIVGIRGNKVQLGIEAPQEVRVIRADLTRDPAGAPDAILSSDADRAEACVPDTTPSEGLTRRIAAMVSGRPVF